MIEDIIKQFGNLLDPSTTLGSFLISALPSLVVGSVVGFFTGKKVTKIQKARTVFGDMNQNSTTNKGK